MDVIVTGGYGFLGRHVAIEAGLRGHAVKLLGRKDLEDESSLGALLDGAGCVIHCAGVNRGPELDVINGNVSAAEMLAAGLRKCVTAPALVYANSIASSGPTPYGRGKRGAGIILANAADRMQIPYSDVQLPNLFGEGGRPFYNSVVATFAYLASQRSPLPIIEDRQFGLAYVQDAAVELIEAAGAPSGAARYLATTEVTVTSLAESFTSFARQYFDGVTPSCETRLASQMFNVFRRNIPVAAPFLQPVARRDQRGVLREGIRHLGAGQVFFSTTLPHQARGNHFHRRKYERFMVLRGRAMLCCRDLLSNNVRKLIMEPEGVCIADMWTYDIHTLENIGEEELVTAFWISEHFDASDPDTYGSSELGLQL